MMTGTNINRLYRFSALFILCLLWIPIVFGIQLQESDVGDSFVHIAMEGSQKGQSIDQVFEVAVRPLNVATERTKNLIASTDFYDGVTYKFRSKKGNWKLYKFEPGKRPMPLTLYSLQFSPAKKIKYMMTLMNTNPKLYNELDLENNLKYLGIMGVTQVGSGYTVDFVKGFNPEDMGGNSAGAVPKFVINNVETMLIRYGYTMYWSGLPSQTIEVDDVISVNFIPIAMQKLSGGVEDIVDDYLNNDQRYEILSAEHRAIPTSNSLIKGAPPFKIKFIYRSYQAPGTTKHGSAKASFVPVEIRLSDTDHFYPIFVFPAAFRSKDTLQRALLRELYHAQWWYEIAYLDKSVSPAKELRELLLRTPLPFWEQHIYETILKNNVKYDILSSEVPGELKMLNRITSEAFLLSINKFNQNPLLMNAEFRIPWTVSPSQVIPDGLHTVADAAYLTALMTENNKKYYLEIPRSPFSGGEKLARDLNQSVLDRYLTAMARGYTSSKEDRNKRLKKSLVEFVNEGVKWIADEFDITNTKLSFSLINEIYPVELNNLFPIDLSKVPDKADAGFQFDDFEWLQIVIEKLYVGKNAGNLWQMIKDLRCKEKLKAIDSQDISKLQNIETIGQTLELEEERLESVIKKRIKLAEQHYQSYAKIDSPLFTFGDYDTGKLIKTPVVDFQNKLDDIQKVLEANDSKDHYEKLDDEFINYYRKITTDALTYVRDPDNPPPSYDGVEVDPSAVNIDRKYVTNWQKERDAVNKIRLQLRSDLTAYIKALENYEKEFLTKYVVNRIANGSEEIGAKEKRALDQLAASILELKAIQTDDNKTEALTDSLFHILPLWKYNKKYWELYYNQHISYLDIVYCLGYIWPNSSHPLKFVDYSDSEVNTLSTWCQNSKPPAPPKPKPKPVKIRVQKKQLSSSSSDSSSGK